MHALLKRRTRILDISRFYNIEHDEIDQKKLKLYFNKTEKKKKVMIESISICVKVKIVYKKFTRY